MTNWRAVAVAVCCAALSGQAIAQRGGICWAKGYHPDAQLSCQHLGSVTFPQIYEKGWRVVAVWTVEHGGRIATMMAIEEQ